MLDLVHVRSFAAVAERGTVAAAAAALGYTGPAVSQHVGKLEARLGTALFERVGGRVTLTAAGTAMLPVVLDLLDTEARARAAVRSPEDMPHVVFAGFASAIATVLVPRLATLRAHCTLEITEAEDAAALRELRLGSVDVVLTQEYDGAPSTRHRRFTFTPLVTDRLVLVVPADRPATTTLEDVRDAPWLLNGDQTRCALATRRILDAAGITPHVVGTIADNAALLALVAAGHGVTVVPARVLDDRAANVTIAHHDLGVTRTILAVTRTATTPTVAPVLDVLRDATAPRPLTS